MLRPKLVTTGWMLAALTLPGCFIVTDDKPANSAPTAVATAPAAASTRESMRSAPPPPPLPDGG